MKKQAKKNTTDRVLMAACRGPRSACRGIMEACREELRAIAEEQLADYEFVFDEKSNVHWGHVGDLASILRQLREIQGKEV